MDSIENVHQHIKAFVQERHSLTPDSFVFTLKRMNSLSNDIYHVQIKDTRTNEMIDEFIYRNFGEVGDIVNRELEEGVINSLSSSGLGPKIYQTDHKTFRIDEYISDSMAIPFNSLKTEKTLAKLISALVSYSEISPIYRYKILENHEIQISKIKNDTEFPVETNQNLYDLCIKDMYQKGISHFNKFKSEIRLDEIKRSDKELFQEKMGRISDFANNLTEIFFQAFPSEGYMTLNHNDTLRLNLLLKDDKVILIDHEYGALNLIGFDIVNYLVETNFDYDPTYKFYPDEIDFKRYYEIYIKFLEAFEESQMHSYFTSNKAEMQRMKSFKYFMNIIIIDTVLWFIFALIYFDFNKYANGVGFDYFQHAYDRVVYYGKIIDCLNSNIN